MVPAAAVSRAQSERAGEMRCPHCFERFEPAEGAVRATCPGCGWEWHISWVGKVAKIRKPVWESWERQISDAEASED